MKLTGTIESTLLRTLAVLASISVLEATIGFWVQLRTQESLQSYSSQTIPELIRTREISKTVDDIAHSSSSLGQIQTIEELEQAEKSYAAQKTAMDKLIGGNSPKELASNTLLPRALEEILDNTGRQLQMVRKQIELRNSFNKGQQETLSHLKKTMTSLETHFYDLSESVESGLAEIFSNKALSRMTLQKVTSEKWQQHHFDLNQVSEVLVQLTSAQTNLTALGVSESRLAIEGLKARFTEIIRDTAARIPLIKDRKPLPDLAANIDTLHSQSLGEEGLFALKTNIAQLSESIQVASELNNETDRKLSDAFGTFLQEMDKRSVQETEASRQRTLLGMGIVLGLGSLSLAIAFFFGRNYVYKRVILRLRSLTRQTKHITEGHLETEIDVTGEDELSELAKSLVVFRNNQRALNSAKEVLVEQGEELESKNAELRTFAYRASHDLKAPLLTIVGLSRLIREDLEDAPGQHKEEIDNLVKVEKVADDLSNLIANILRLTTADGEMEVERFSLHALAAKIEGNLQGLLQQNHVQMALDLPHEITLTTERVRVRQILENLISNGIKYCDPKKENRRVWIRARQTQDKVEIEVSDNGVGIPEEHQNRVFGMFERLSSQVQGSGLGLYLVKRHVERLSGRIWFRTSDQGTSFFVELPRVAKRSA